MKKMENSFAVTGFVGKDASIHQFTTASVARFSLAISRNEKNGDENSRTSAFMNVEAWRKNENTASFGRLVKGALLTVEGYFKPEEWHFVTFEFFPCKKVKKKAKINFSSS